MLLPSVSVRFEAGAGGAAFQRSRRTARICSGSYQPDCRCNWSCDCYCFHDRCLLDSRCCKLGIALCIYTVLVVLLLNGFDVTLTLSGIAGIILSIGMAVDANVIIFARIREEIATGKTVKSAIQIGFKKALSAIIDGNVTTLIAAVVLYFMGIRYRQGLCPDPGTRYRRFPVYCAGCNQADPELHSMRLGIRE